MNIGGPSRELKPKAPLLAKNARNGAPSLFKAYAPMGDVGHPPDVEQGKRNIPTLNVQLIAKDMRVSMSQPFSRL
jgi:hypothetical protein